MLFFNSNYCSNEDIPSNEKLFELHEFREKKDWKPHLVIGNRFYATFWGIQLTQHGLSLLDNASITAKIEVQQSLMASSTSTFIKENVGTKAAVESASDVKKWMIEWISSTPPENLAALKVSFFGRRLPRCRPKGCQSNLNRFFLKNRMHTFKKSMHQCVVPLM
jgi:hypothetical protein